MVAVVEVVVVVRRDVDVVVAERVVVPQARVAEAAVVAQRRVAERVVAGRHRVEAVRRAVGGEGVAPELELEAVGEAVVVAVDGVRVRAEEGLEQQARALESEQPLWALWRFSIDPAGIAMAMAFTGLAGQSQVIRAEVADYSERFRAAQTEALAKILERYDLPPDTPSPAALIVLLTSVSRVVMLEEALGVTSGHAEVIGSLIEQALAEATLTVSDITHVAAGMGPGPFTGLRVGIAAARAFALGRGIPVVPVVSHDGVALELLLHDALTGGLDGDDLPFAVVTDARRREYAYSVYRGLDDDGLPLPIADIAEVWRHGSIVSSKLLDVTAAALKQDDRLRDFSGKVDDTGEGRWTIQTAIDRAIPAMTLTAALYARFRSRREANFADKLISAMRRGFGGHVEAKGKS